MTPPKLAVLLLMASFAMAIIAAIVVTQGYAEFALYLCLVGVFLMGLGLGTFVTANHYHRNNSTLFRF